MQIEKNIPIPDKINRRATLKKMEIGDSLLCETEKEADTWYMAAYQTPKGEPQLKVIKRKVKGGFRIWRVK